MASEISLKVVVPPVDAKESPRDMETRSVFDIFLNLWVCGEGRGGGG